MSICIVDITDELILHISDFLNFKYKYKLYSTCKSLQKLFRKELYTYFVSHDEEPNPYSNGMQLLGKINSIKEGMTIILPPEKFYISPKNYMFEKSIHLMGYKSYTNLIINSFITFDKKCYFGLTNIDFVCDSTSFLDDCAILINHAKFFMNKCRILCFSYRCINIIDSIVNIFNTNMCGSKTINAFNSCLFVKECDITNSNEPIVLDTTNIILYNNNIINCNRNAIYAYRGNIEIIGNIINNTRKHGIKLIEPDKCIINSNKINNTSKNGIHIIEPNNVEITDNTISSNEKNGIRITCLTSNSNIDIVRNYISYNVYQGISIIGGNAYIYNNHLIFNLNCGIYCIGVTTSLDYNTIKNDGTPCMVLKKSLFTLNENKLAVNNYTNDIEVS